MNENAFSYTYSATCNQEVLNIRKKYLPKEEDRMEQLRKLHAIPTQKAPTASIVLGTIGSLVMGTGMSLVMTDIGSVVGLASAMVPGIAIGVVGMGMALTTYPIYKRILNSRKKKYAPEIMALSEKIMNG